MIGVLRSHWDFDTIYKELLILFELKRVFEVRFWAVGADELLSCGFGFGWLGLSFL
jgi:hypothetical protein